MALLGAFLFVESLNGTIGCIPFCVERHRSPGHIHNIIFCYFCKFS